MGPKVSSICPFSRLLLLIKGGFFFLSTVVLNVRDGSVSIKGEVLDAVKHLFIVSSWFVFMWV